MTRGCRKICRCRLHQGTRWVPLLNFDVKHWGDNTHTWASEYQAWCRACHRIYARRRKAVKEGRDPDKTEPRNGGMPREEKARRQASEYQRRMDRVDPVTGETGRTKLNRTQREAARIRRRDAGVPERGVWARYRERDGESMYGGMVEFAPLQQWIEESGLAWREAEYVRSHKRKQEGRSMTTMGAHQTEAPWDPEIRRRLQAAAKRGTISTVVVDRVLMHVGRPDMMVVLYGGLDHDEGSR